MTTGAGAATKTAMFFSAKVIRCKKCKRLFSNFADNCPECMTKTPRGWLSTVVPIVCIVIALAALWWTIHFLANRPQDP